jgi:hypothetical protein
MRLQLFTAPIRGRRPEINLLEASSTRFLLRRRAVAALAAWGPITKPPQHAVEQAGIRGRRQFDAALFLL